MRNKIRRVTSAILLVACCLSAPRQAHAHGELEIQIGLLTQKISAATNNAGSLYLVRGDLHREHKDWVAAEADYAQARKLDNSLPVDLARAQLLDEQGRGREAVKLLSGFIQTSPENYKAYLARARSLAKLNELSSSAKDFERTLKLSKHPKPEYFLEYAQVLVAQNKTEEALPVLEKGLIAFPTNYALQDFALEAQLKQKNFSAAIKLSDAILKNASRKESELARQGRIFMTAGRPAEARQSFEASLQAVHALPVRLQQSPALQQLQSDLQSALDDLARAAQAHLLTQKNER